MFEVRSQSECVRGKMMLSGRRGEEEKKREGEEEVGQTGGLRT